MGIVEIEGMHFYAYHGHFEAERIVGNEFLVDVWLETDCLKAAASDNLEDALNYQAVYDLVKKEMQVKSHLLEHVAGRILDALLEEFTSIQKAKIKVSKLNPPMGGQIEKASVTLMR
ncbi:dihydroneopterin aldolase [Mariniphaga sp.]|uniref:dihydroneopterin aldolase n=1 Tax=Mariniphaga sp. TaxID=1954475 RepID=UPI003564A478